MRRHSSPCLGQNAAPQPAAVGIADAATRGEREPPRRRSTVREPAPVFSGSAPAVTPTPCRHRRRPRRTVIQHG